MSASVSSQAEQNALVLPALVINPIQLELLKNSLCAGTAAALATGTFNPLDTVGVRWQLTPALSGSTAAATPSSGSLFSFARDIIAKEGFVTGLWRPGATATMLSMGTSCGVRMGCYPYLRDWVAGDPTRKTPTIMFATGLVAGGVGLVVLSLFSRQRPVFRQQLCSL